MNTLWQDIIQYSLIIAAGVLTREFMLHIKALNGAKRWALTAYLILFICLLAINF